MAKPSKSVKAATPEPVRSFQSEKIVPKTVKSTDYTSEGVRDHDIFLLPGSDYQVMIVATILAAIVRLFRIYQPSSVVFDEVQYVAQLVFLLIAS
jgi:dolichyl-phosphate-mannose-protein mannosyltransferase